MRCIVVLMSQSSSSATTEDLSTASTPNPESMLAGFPWVSAIILYTLSWGWSLLRPNTLYWDDWAVIFGYQEKNIWLSTKPLGLAPWSRLIEWPILLIGPWTICLATFLCFFVTGIFLFGILKKVPIVEDKHAQMLVLLFLVVPVNHARISLIVFDYTFSYLLFFLGWLILVRSRLFRSFVLSLLILFLSLKTHSFLFFLLLPFLHFGWLNREGLLKVKKLKLVHLQVVLIAFMPFLYLILRNNFWPPSKLWVSYHKPTFQGFVLGVFLFSPVIFTIVFYFSRVRRTSKPIKSVVGFGFGVGVTALALFPYFLGGFYPDYLSVIAIRSDWGSRHQLLMPLGLAVTIVGLDGVGSFSKKNLIFKICVAFSLMFNLYFASTYYVDSIKKDEVIKLLASRIDIEEDSQIVIIDDSKRFNGRGSSYRDYEWKGLLSLAGKKFQDASKKRMCDAQPSAIQLTLQSNTPYLKALVTRDLGLYFEAKPCSEVLAENG
jgi:hypothetical protein